MLRGGSVDNKNCSTCKNTSRMGVNILGIHICRDCLSSIENLQIGEGNYDYYKNIIARAWTKHCALKTN